MKILLRLFLFLVVVISVSNAQDVKIYMKKDSVARFPISIIDSISFAPCYPDSFTVISMYPNPDCATIETRPTINWEVQLPKRNLGDITYEVTLVEMSDKDTSLSMFEEKKPLLVRKDLKIKNFEYPAALPELSMGRIYAWRVKAFEGGNFIAVSDIKLFYIINYKFPFDIREVTCCIKNLLSNGTLESGNLVGVLGERGKVLDWHTAYGKPFVMPDDDGCNSPGYVQLEGNKTTGSSIKQALHPTNRILKGKHYRFSSCVRLRNVKTNSNHFFIKAVAYNSTLPATGFHPQPNSDLAIIGWSGKLTLNEWGTISLPVWTPNKNFDNIAIYCYTNSSDTIAYIDIDNLCLVETKDSIPCDDYTYDGNGYPIIDTMITEAAKDTTYNYYDEYTGSTSDLYSSQGNTSLDTWYPYDNPCASVGGTIPLEAQNVNFNDTLISLGFMGGVEELDSLLSQNFPDSSAARSLPPIPPLDKDCKNKPFVYDENLPFGGRDIIFVHGLSLQHLCERRDEVPGATADWPNTKQEFYYSSSHYGYYKKLADSLWADHIKTWLRSKGYNNRYLIVTYNCSQRLDVAAHAVLTQIRDAMQDGTGVQAVETDVRKNECFGRNSLIISHSTGGLVTDVALSIAEKSKTDASVQANYGNCGYIADNTRAHLAFHPALAGSKMATVFLALQTAPVLSTVINSQICHGLRVPSLEMLAITFQSILVDLVPLTVQFKWKPYINSSPVPTITISGGHPVGVDGAGVLNWAIHPGLDDGVVTMSSGAGNPNFETGLAPSGYWRAGLFTRVYDMGISSGRANSYYMHQTLFTMPGYIGGAAITSLSPTGMLQPVGSVTPALSCENRYNNHYSFLQSASDHYIGPRGKKPEDGYQNWNYPTGTGFPAPNYHYADGYGVNNEESRAITTSDIYTKGLVGSAVANLQEEHIRGLNITIPIPIPNLSIKCCPLKIKFWISWYYIVIPIWERKYHLMAGYKTNCECSYAYKYVLRP